MNVFFALKGSKLFIIIDSDDLTHMLLKCPALSDVRKVSLAQIRDLVGEKFGSSVWSSLSKSEVVAIMVGSHSLRSVTPEPVDNEIILQLEALSRRYCYWLHSKRLQLYRNLTN